MPNETDGLVLPVGVTEQKALKQLARIEARALKAERQVTQNFVRQNRHVVRSFDRMSGSVRGNLQNVSFQLQDIFVQISSGQGATRALSQQLPQLLGGFGALGAVFGLAAAAGIPLAAALLDIGDAAEDLDAKLKNLDASIKAVREAESLAAQSPGDLLDQFGGLADEAQRIFEINRQIAAIKAQSALDDAARGVAGELGVAGVFGFVPAEIRDLETTIGRVKAELADLNSTPASALSDTELAAANREIEKLESSLRDLKTVSGNVDNLADQLGITEMQAREVVAQFAEIGQAQGPREQAQAMLDLADYISGASQNLANAEEEGKALYDQLLAAAIKALDLSKSDYGAGNISTAADEAARLAGNLAAARAERINSITGDNPDFFDPRGESRGAGRLVEERDVPRQNRPGYTPPATRNRRGSSGGGGGSDPQLTAAEALFRSTRTEAEQYAAELERINELHRLFPQIITDEVKDRAIKALEDSVQSLDGMAASLESSLEDAFTSFVTGATSAKEAVSDLIGELARMAAQSAFQSLGLGKLLGSAIPGYAAGTNYAPGGLALVGERGPELVNLPRGSQVIPSHRMGGGGGAVDVRIAMDGGGNLVPIIERVSGSVAARVTAAGMQQVQRNTGANLQSFSKRQG